MKRVLLTLVLTSFLAGCGTILSTETSWRFVMAPKVELITKDEALYIRVKGHLLSSSCAVRQTSYTQISDTEVWVHVREGIVTNRNQSGSFDIHVPISELTERIYFGKEKTVIWSKNEN